MLAGVSTTVFAGVIAFGAVAFMHLATEEVLVRAQVGGETATGPTAFHIGFLAVLVIKQALR